MEIGIHSVGTNPSGSTMPCLPRPLRQLAGVDHRNGICGHVGHIQPAAIRIHRQRHRLRAKVALPRAAAYRNSPRTANRFARTSTAATASRLASAT